VTAGEEPSLADQRQSMREQLQAQRQRIAEQLAPGADAGRFPRSFTVRLLVRQPELLFRLLVRVPRARLVGSIIAILVLVRLLRAHAAAGAQVGPASP